MKLSVATNFDDELIERLQGYPVYDVFGKLSSDIVGGGRSSYMIGSITKRRLRQHIEKIHRAGTRFNYLLNTACLDNMEQTRTGHQRIRKLLDEVSDMGVDSVTISLPFLLRVIKRSYPHLAVRISVFAQVDTVSKAQWWMGEGADTITLDSHAVNREFKTLQKIRQAVKGSLQLMVNGHCVSRCPMANYHMTTLAHSSQSKHESSGFNVDYCFLNCTTQKLKRPSDYLRGDWIRPEDLHLYEAMGYDSFKIVERSAPTEVLVNRVKAYTERRYSGNFLDLIQPFGYKQGGKMIANARRSLWGSFSNLWKFMRYRTDFLGKTHGLARKRGWLQQLSGEPVYIDNKSLEGFMDRFAKEGCRNADCNKCQHCDQWAAKAISVDASFRENCVADVAGILEQFETGRCWR